MRTILLMLLLFTATIGVQAQPNPKYIQSDAGGKITQDTLDMSDTTVTCKYRFANPVSGVFVTIKSTKPDTIRLWARPAPFPMNWELQAVRDTSDQKLMIYQPERSASADSLVILQAVIGTGYYQARFRIYEPILTDPFYLKVAYKKAAVMFITFKTKD